MKKTTNYILFAISFSLTFSLTAQQPTFEWVKKHGGFNDEIGLAITTDKSGNVLTTGYFQGKVDFDPGALTTKLNSNGGDDIFIQKLDPQGNLLWVKQIGGVGHDRAQSIITDESENIYLTGHFRQTVDFNPSIGVSNLTSNGIDDVFILKLNASGNLLWVKQFGGNDYDKGQSIFKDKYDGIYIAGSFRDTVELDAGSGLSSLISNGNDDIFIQKLDTSGNFIWVKHIGGSGSEQALAITTDLEGNVYTTGYFNGTTDFDPSSTTVSLTSNGVEDIFIQKLDSAGNFKWANHYGGVSYDRSSAITTDTLGNIYTTGYFFGTVNFDTGSNMTTLNALGGSDIFIQKLDSGGNLTWVKQLGGTSSEQAFAICADSKNNVYTSGFFQGTADFDPDTLTMNLISEGGRDIFIHKVDSTGNLVWAKKMGGTSNEMAHSMAIDNYNNLILTGFFNRTVDFNPDTTSTNNLTSNGRYDIFIQKFNQCSNIDVTTYVNAFTITANNTRGTYQWLDCNNNNSPIQNEINQSFTASSSGNYAVKIIENGCVDTSSCVNISTVGMAESRTMNQFSIYPNPTKGKFSIVFNQIIKNVEIKVFDIYGKLISNKLPQYIYKNISSVDLNIQNHAAGLYFVEVKTAEDKQTIRLIKK